jgi:hypothetical protein
MLGGMAADPPGRPAASDPGAPVDAMPRGRTGGQRAEPMALQNPPPLKKKTVGGFTEAHGVLVGFSAAFVESFRPSVRPARAHHRRASRRRRGTQRREFHPRHRGGMSGAVALAAGAHASKAWPTAGVSARQRQSAAAASERRRPTLRRGGVTTRGARARATPVGALAPEEGGKQVDEVRLARRPRPRSRAEPARFRAPRQAADDDWHATAPLRSGAFSLSTSPPRGGGTRCLASASRTRCRLSPEPPPARASPRASRVIF